MVSLRQSGLVSLIKQRSRLILILLRVPYNFFKINTPTNYSDISILMEKYISHQEDMQWKLISTTRTFD